MPEYHLLMQNRIAELAANNSSLRKQGKGVVKKTRKRLKQLNLAWFVVRSQPKFERLLDEATDKLQELSFGAARKVLNIFLRNCLYNRYLCEHYRLRQIENWLEVPLDSHVASRLRERNPSLCRWTTLKNLRQEDHAAYQITAAERARAEKMLRADLDLLWWRNPVSGE